MHTRLLIPVVISAYFASDSRYFLHSLARQICTTFYLALFQRRVLLSRWDWGMIFDMFILISDVYVRSVNTLRFFNFLAFDAEKY